VGECFLDHFQRAFGEPVAREVFEQEGFPATIQVLSYDRVFKGCRLFCSLGLSHYEGSVGSLGEVYTVVDDGWPAIPCLLANSLFYMVQTRLALDQGTVVGGIENLHPRFSVEFGKTALYITNPYGLPAGSEYVDCSGTRGHVFLGLFISEAERIFLRSHGASVFEDVLEREGVDPYVLRRKDCV
jgi:hypothetical protein